MGAGAFVFFSSLSVAARIGQDVCKSQIREPANGCSGTKIASNEARAISNVGEMSVAGKPVPQEPGGRVTLSAGEW